MEDERPEDGPAGPRALCASSFFWVALLTFCFLLLAWSLSFPIPPAPPWPTRPSPTVSSPSMISSSAMLKFTRFWAFLSSVIPYLSFIFRSLRPPRRFFGPESGTASGLMILAGGGSCHFSIFFSISCRSLPPAAPSASSPWASTLASKAHLPATSRRAFFLS